MADTYASILATLRRERAQIDSAIALIESVRAAGGSFARAAIARARIATPAPDRVHRGGNRPRLDHDALRTAYEAGVSDAVNARRAGCNPDYVRTLASRKGWKRHMALATPLFDGARAH